jgi:membrane protease YdiL (CAAX protease family)
MLSEKPWKLDGLLRFVICLVMCVSVMLTLSAVIQHFTGAKTTEDSTALLVVNTLALDGSILIAVFIFLRLEHITWADAFGFKTPRPGLAILWGVIIAACFLPIGLYLNYLCTRALESFHVKAPEQQAVETLKNALPGATRVFLVFFAVVIAPVAEESFFRGILYPTIKQNGFPRAALWVTSFLFAAIHANLSAFLPLAILALALAILYEKTNNLLACITAHSVFNAANVLLLYLTQSPVTRPPY